MMQKTGLIDGFLAGLRPTLPIKVSAWADSYRYLSSQAAAEPGQWRTERTPYLREIMDRLSVNDVTEEIVFMKGAQIGATEAGNNWLGYIIDIAPGPSMMVMPTDTTVKRNSKGRIDPMIEATPTLRTKVKPARARDSGNTTFSKAFPGGVLVMAGANSAVGLRSMPVKNLMLDEIDGYPVDLDGEGSPIALATARTRTFPKRKIFKISTPTVEGASAIQAEFADTDQRKYFVPCPDCGGMQTLEFDNLVYEKGKALETGAKYQCMHCGYLIEERFKTVMLAGGQWQVTNPEKASFKKGGYHLNSLYSPFGWYSWAEAADDYDKAENDSNKLKTFTNTVLGLPYAEKGEVPQWELLYGRREHYVRNKPCKDVFMITAGVDVQRDRLEVEIVAWGKGKRSWSLDYRVLQGETHKPGVWAQLSLIVNETWEREDGLLLPMKLMAVDTGFNTSHVYTFCRKHDPARVIPIKGQAEQITMVAAPRIVDKTSKGKAVGKLMLWNIGVSMIKSELYGWLRLHEAEGGEYPVGYCHFPEYDIPYFRGLTAEQQEFKIEKGFRKYFWVKKYDRNEPLDCRVYARAAAAVAGLDRYNDTTIALLLEGLGRATSTQKKKKKRPTSDFW